MLKPVMADFDCASCGHGMECESDGRHDQDLYYSFFESYFRVRNPGLASLSPAILDHTRHFRPCRYDKRFQSHHLDREFAPAVGHLIQRGIGSGPHRHGLWHGGCGGCRGPVGRTIAGSQRHRPLPRACANNADSARRPIAADGKAGVGRGWTETGDRHGCVGLPAPIPRRGGAILPVAGQWRGGGGGPGRHGRLGRTRGRRGGRTGLARCRADTRAEQDEEGCGEGKVGGKAHCPPMPARRRRLNWKRMSGRAAGAGRADAFACRADIDTVRPNR